MACALAVAPLSAQEKESTGAARYRFALLIGNARINFYADSGISGTECDKITRIWQLGVKDVFSLPAAAVVETAQPDTLRETALPRGGARVARKRAARCAAGTARRNGRGALGILYRV